MAVISIHLMLMLILHRPVSFDLQSVHFNTSHVNVNLCLPESVTSSYSYFNTSHVNVNLSPCLLKNTFVLFQYISC